MIGKNKGDIFLTLLSEEMEKVKITGETFLDLVNNYEDVNNKIAGMKVLETECDMQAHKILNAMNTTRTPLFAREDLFSLIREIDDIVDGLEEVANRFGVFNVEEIRPDAKKMADIVIQAINELSAMFEHLSEIKKPAALLEHIIEVNRIENEGDLIYRKALANLFSDEKDPIEIIKWKHIYEKMETSIDACESVANMIEGVIMKYA
ncbi:MAG: DUF47 domain-containing protein [Eubacteriales Family XIII. Incertae Sedis bacterium]|nr:MAG: DUF47 domain-containing protein [Clostridiales Family XIII bacterium]